MKLKVVLGACLWTLLITVAHIHLNVGWARLVSKTRVFLELDREELIVGFLPVTWHLTCPVTSWVTKHSDTGSFFRSQKFTDWPTVTEALSAKEIGAAFLPRAMTHREHPLTMA